MLKFMDIERFDDFDTEVIYWVVVSGIPEEFIRKAKEIDSDNYSDDCFGVCFLYYKDSKKFMAVMEETEKYIYYIDNHGNKNWMSYKLNEQETEMIIKKIKSVVDLQIND